MFYNELLAGYKKPVRTFLASTKDRATILLFGDNYLSTQEECHDDPEPGFVLITQRFVVRFWWRANQGRLLIIS